MLLPYCINYAKISAANLSSSPSSSTFHNRLGRMDQGQLALPQFPLCQALAAGSTICEKGCTEKWAMCHMYSIGKCDYTRKDWCKLGMHIPQEDYAKREKRKQNRMREDSSRRASPEAPESRVEDAADAKRNRKLRPRTAEESPLTVASEAPERSAAEASEIQIAEDNAKTADDYCNAKSCSRPSGEDRARLAIDKARLNIYEEGMPTKQRVCGAYEQAKQKPVSDAEVTTRDAKNASFLSILKRLR